MMNRRLTLRALAAAMLLVPLAACKPQVLPTQIHSPSDPATVKVYQNKPAHYEDLGTITLPITNDIKWDERGDAKPAYALMRKKVAELGGNGILLDVDTGANSRMVGAGDGEKFYLVPVTNEPKAAVIKAIFVHQE